ncbi:MAG: hypothetical protein RBT69_11890, partial [Spirochaetia bacterium]|nr:hypothetical protein [Spirochaetia bacterium]
SDDKNIYLEVRESAGKVNGTYDPFAAMLAELKNLVRREKDNRILFTKLNNVLIKKKIDIKELGYSRLKKFLQDAEKRDLVKIESEGLNYYVTITDKGSKYSA